MNSKGTLKAPQALFSKQIGEYFYELIKRPAQDRNKPPRVLIVHSSANSAWTRKLATHLESNLNDLYPEKRNLCVDQVVIGGSRDEIQKKLLGHPGLAGKQEPFSYIITPGFWETMHVHSLRKAGWIHTPQIYCTPSGVGHVHSALTSDVNASGVCSMPIAYDHYFITLKALLDKVETICAAYSPGTSYHGTRDFMAEQLTMVQAAAAHHGITILPHRWSTDHMRHDELRELVQHSHAVLTLRDPAAHVHHEKLLDVCIEEKVPLCASQLDSVANGAAIGYGNAGSFYAAPLARLILKSTVTQQPLGEIAPLTFDEQQVMRYNPYTLEEQGISLSKEKKALLEMHSVFDELPVNFNIQE